MSKYEGIQYTCTRCGATEFAKCIGVVDLGFNDQKKYEELEGWMHQSEIGDLCPHCADEFKLFVTNFMGGNVAPAWKYEGPMEG